MNFPPRLLGVFCLVFLWSPAAWSQATIQGHVELPKTRSTPVMNKRYEVVTKGDVLSTNPPLAVVYLEGAFPKPSTLPTKQMSQKIEFPNFYDTFHDVFSFAPAKRFDLGRYRPDAKPVPSQIFDMSGLVTVRCDIHEHMRALILVLDTPHFVLTDDKGNFRLDDLPPGHYTLKAWVDSRTTLEHPVDVSKSGTLQVNFP